MNKNEVEKILNKMSKLGEELGLSTCFIVNPKKLKENSKGEKEE